MKTKFIYTAALVVMAAVMLAAPFRAAGAQSGAATPQELGNKVLEAIKAQNKDALKSLRMLPFSYTDRRHHAGHRPGC